MKTSKTPRNSLSCNRTVRQLLTMTFVVALFVATMISPAYATTFQDSDFFKGGLALLSDLMICVTIAAPVIMTLFISGYLIRRGMADEQDKKTWTKRAYDALFCGVAVMIASSFLAVVFGYFAPSKP